MPKIYGVNWFRKSEKGEFLWPGFGENMRVLEWIFNRVSNKVGATETAIGFIPRAEDLNCEALNLKPEILERLLSVDKKEWASEVAQQPEVLKSYGERVPKALWEQHQELKERLG